MKVLTVIISLLIIVLSGYSEDTISYSLNCNSYWVMMAPTNFNPQVGQFPHQESIREDIDTLFRYGFRGLGTYASDGTLYHIPRIARKQGFTGKIIMGIWDPRSDLEIANAISCSAYVSGYCIGNEGLNARYTIDTLEQVMDSIRVITGLPVTTAEEIDDYLEDSPSAQWLLSHGDWLFPIVHPYWCEKKNPQEAVDWTVLMFDSLRSLTSKQVILKEVGLPSGGCTECSEDSQAQYYRLLEETDVVFFYFEAFDQPWKTWDPVEPHWGLFRSDRSPKKVVLDYGYAEDKVQYSLSLSQNSPNPFVQRTTIGYQLLARSMVSLKIYDITGRLVYTLVNEKQNAGLHKVKWDGRDGNSKKVKDNIYFYRLSAGNFSDTKKMIIFQ